MENLIGKSLGRYQIREELGKGGMAIVYKAYDTRLEKDVAVKIIWVDQYAPADLEQVLQRFDFEAKTLAQLSHANIVRVIDYDKMNGIPYLVMEYLPGGSLKQCIGKQVTWHEAARLLLPIARALEYAHSHDVVHRDVKPSNILFGESGEPMLADFGIAKKILEGGGQSLTATGNVVGTYEYMAPEQCKGRMVKQSDIYSLGVIFYELITGRKPYLADNPTDFLVQQATEPIPRPVRFAPSLPERVEQALLRALAREPALRYQTMAEFASVLEMIEKGQLDKSRAGSLEETQTVDQTNIGEMTQILVQHKPSLPGIWIGRTAVAVFVGICAIGAIVFGYLYFSNRTEPTPTSFVPSITSPGRMNTAIPSLHPVTQPSSTFQTSPTTPTIIPFNAPILLAYVFSSGDFSSSVVNLATEDGTNSHTVSFGSGSNSEPTVSPDGMYVVYQSNLSEGNQTSGQLDLYITSTTGSDTRNLTRTDSFSEREPSFSPDGKQIAFRVGDLQDSNSDIYVMNTNGGNARKLEIQGRGPVWSPDGQRLVYMYKDNGIWQIYVYMFSNGKSHPITKCSLNCRWPAWSPTGEYIIYNTMPVGSSQPDSIRYIRADGTGSEIIVTNVGNPGRPSWSTSGWIAFNSNNGIEIIRSDGSGRSILIHGDSHEAAPCWSR